MLIRPLDTADLSACARLLRASATEFIVHESPPEGACTFLRENDEEGIRGYLAAGYIYHVAQAPEELAGFIAIRDDGEKSHVFHLFIDKRWHRQGLARRLWDVARAATLARGGSGAFTVNASNYAVPVYASFGFEPTAPTQCVKGLYFNPMLLTPA